MQFTQFLNKNRQGFIATILSGFFAFSSIHQLSPHRVNKGSQLLVEPVSTSCLHTEACFPPFYIGLHFTRNVAWMNLLSMYWLEVRIDGKTHWEKRRYVQFVSELPGEVGVFLCFFYLVGSAAFHPSKSTMVILCQNILLQIASYYVRRSINYLCFEIT